MKLRIADRPPRDLATGGVFLLVCMLLVFAAIWAYRAFITTPPYVDPERYPVRGIDVSAHNGAIDMQRVAADGIEFAFVKATEGVDFQDKRFRANYDAAVRAGLKVGVYHFFRFDRDGIEQAINFMRAVGHRRPQLGYVIDVEKSGNPPGIDPDTVAMRLSQMADYLNLLGHTVTFYTNREGYYDYLHDNFAGARLWICGFSQTPINAEWTFWQHNHRGRVDGIKGDVDLDVFCGSRTEWANFLNGALWPYSSTD